MLRTHQCVRENDLCPGPNVAAASHNERTEMAREKNDAVDHPVISHYVISDDPAGSWIDVRCDRVTDAHAATNK